MFVKLIKDEQNVRVKETERSNTDFHAPCSKYSSAESPQKIVTSGGKTLKSTNMSAEREKH